MAMLPAMAVFTGTNEVPRSQLPYVGVIVKKAGKMTWSKKPVILSKVPFTAIHPTLAQIDVRIKFGEAGAKAKDMEGLDPETGLPWGATYVMKEVKGYRSPYRRGKTARRTVHRLSELRTLLNKAKEEKTKR